MTISADQIIDAELSANPRLSSEHQIENSDTCFEFCFNFLKQYVARINVQNKSQKAYPAR